MERCQRRLDVDGEIYEDVLGDHDRKQMVARRCQGTNKADMESWINKADGRLAGGVCVKMDTAS